MILHSIRWRLQLWHALLLLLVLAGFGFTAHRLDRESRLRRIDQELQQRLDALAGTLRRRGPDRPGPFRSPGQPNRPEPGRAGGFEEGFDPVRTPPPHDFRLPERETALFETGAEIPFYYMIWLRDGRVLAQSETAPADVPWPMPERGTLARMRGTWRELSRTTPPGECLLVGRDIKVELSEMRRLGWLLAAAGGGVLLVGLLGGWWLSGRALRPVQEISATAARISTGDLSQRIRTAETAGELGQLAGVLNSTFERLEAAFLQQARFTADAAHELRTPVSVILVQAQAALARERSPGDYREALAACERAAARMAKLIESLLQLARLDSGQEPMTRHSCDLARLASECVEQLRPLAAERRLTLHTDLAAAECAGDADRLMQVVTNLLANAIHYNKDGGEVRVRTGIEGTDALLSVEDTGPGIAEEDRPHLFERFFRADKSRTSAQGRTGLGLAICKAIVDAHHGRLEVSSLPGAGSRFTVRLPQNARA